jgi:hypothetical protein
MKTTEFGIRVLLSLLAKPLLRQGKDLTDYRPFSSVNLNIALIIMSLETPQPSLNIVNSLDNKYRL